MSGGKSAASGRDFLVAPRARRTALLDRRTLERMIVSSERGHALILLAVDDLALFAAAQGAMACDDILTELGRRLCRHAPDAAHVARLEGEVFAVLLDVHDVARTAAEARTVTRRVMAPFRVEGRQVHLTASQGVATSQPWGDGNSGLIDRAAMALERARGNGKGGVAFFDIDMDPESPHVLSIADDLKSALAGGALSLAYRPVMDLCSGEIASVEAMLQWRHPVRGTMPAAIAGSIAERFGLAGDIGEWMLDATFDQVRRWRRDCELRWTTSITLFASQACDPRFADAFLAKACARGIDPEDISVSVKEATAVSQINLVLPTIRTLAMAGVICSLDGFGEGGITFPQLQALPIDEVRVGEGLVCSIESDRHDMTFVDGLVSIAHAFGLRVTADGIQSQGQQALLAKLGCDAVQGYFVGRRMPGEDVPEFIGAAARATPLSRSPDPVGY